MRDRGFRGLDERRQSFLDADKDNGVSKDPPPPNLPQRLARISSLPWLGCWQQQLQTEGKSENTSKSYLIGVRRLIETALPGEIILSRDQAVSLTVEELHIRIATHTGRLELWQQSLNQLKPSTVHARLAAAGHLLRWLGHSMPDHISRPHRGKRLPRTLNRNELEMVLRTAANWENPVANIIITILLDTGFSQFAAVRRTISSSFLFNVRGSLLPRCGRLMWSGMLWPSQRNKCPAAANLACTVDGFN
jgi:hypothetical protein